MHLYPRYFIFPIIYFTIFISSFKGTIKKTRRGGNSIVNRATDYQKGGENYSSIKKRVVYFHSSRVSSRGDENFGTGEPCRITHAGHYSWLIALKTVALTVSRARVTARVTIAAPRNFVKRTEEGGRRGEQRGKRGGATHVDAW